MKKKHYILEKNLSPPLRIEQHEAEAPLARRERGGGLIRGITVLILESPPVELQDELRAFDVGRRGRYTVRGVSLMLELLSLLRSLHVEGRQPVEFSNLLRVADVTVK